LFGDNVESAPAEVAMHYRVHGHDETSQSPVEPFFLDAADEDEARNQASELGVFVGRVEVAPQKDEAIPPRDERATSPETAVSLATARGPAAPRPFQPRPRRWGLLVGFVLVPMSLAAGIGIGIMLPRAPFVGPTPLTTPAAAPAAAPAGIRLEELTRAEELFDLADQKAVVLKYSGGELDFWIEFESRGEKVKVGKVASLTTGLDGGEKKSPAPNQAVEGYLLWVRDAEDTGRERWRVACRRDLVAAERSGLQVTTPLVVANVTQSREDRRTGTHSTIETFQVWKGKRPNTYVLSATGSIPNPIPSDRDVCIREIHEKGMRYHEYRALSASIIGLLGSPGGGGPLLAATALNPAGPDEPVEEHTIKLMCRAASNNGKGPGNEPVGK
jgi:hypothetical protein